VEGKEKALHRGVALMLGYLLIAGLTVVGAIEVTNKIRLGLVLRPVVVTIDAAKLEQIVNQ